MRTLVVPGVVTDVADSYRIGLSYPLLTEVLSASDAVNKLGANFAFQFGNHLFCTFLLSDAVKPRHRLVLAIKIVLPLLKCSVFDASFLRAFLLSFLSSLHGESPICTATANRELIEASSKRGYTCKYVTRTRTYRVPCKGSRKNNKN